MAMHSLGAAEIAVLLHHRYTREPHPKVGSVLYAQLCSKLRFHSLLDTATGPPTVTTKGCAYVDMLLDTPLPIARDVLKWVDPR